MTGAGARRRQGGDFGARDLGPVAGAQQDRGQGRRSQVRRLSQGVGQIVVTGATRGAQDEAVQLNEYAFTQQVIRFARARNHLTRAVADQQRNRQGVETGQYGVDNLYVGVPCVIGAAGVERIVEIALDEQARKNFDVSVDAVKELLVACKAIDGSLS